MPKQQRDMKGFDILPLGQKVKVIKTSAKPVTEFVFRNEIVMLYRIGDILVERVSDPDSKKITKISSVDRSHLLLYLPHLGFSSIIKLITN
jgi:hypothetical protein